MSLLVFQHIETEDTACLGQTLQQHGHRLQHVELFNGDPVPGDLRGVDGVISMGGPMNVDQVDEHPWIADELELLRAAHEAELPVVGVCLGAQLIATALGGKVEAMEKGEVGWQPIRLAFPGTVDTIMTGQPWNATQFHLHAQQVTELPPGAAPLAGSLACKVQAFKVGFRTYGFQYHFEWDRKQIERFANDPLVEASGGSPGAIIADADEYFPGYRRLGDRLAESIATYLLAIDKRRTA